MRLTARSDFTEPMVSTTRAGGNPRRPSRNGSMATRSPSRASPAMPAGITYSRPAARFSTGDRASRSVRRAAVDGEGARPHLVQDLDHPAGIGGRLGTGVGVELDPHQNARPDARGRRAVAFHARTAHEDARRRLIAGPFHGFRDQFAVSVFLGDVGDNQGRQAGPRPSAPYGHARQRLRPADP